MNKGPCLFIEDLFGIIFLSNCIGIVVAYELLGIPIKQRA